MSTNIAPEGSTQEGVSLVGVTLVGYSALLDRTLKALSRFPGAVRLTRYEEGVSHSQFRLSIENVTNRVRGV